VMPPVFGKKNKGHFLPPLFMNSQDDVLHIPNGPLLRGDNSPNTPPALVGGGCIVGDMRFLRAAKVIEARLKTRLATHLCEVIIPVPSNPQYLWITLKPIVHPVTATLIALSTILPLAADDFCLHQQMFSANSALQLGDNEQT
jgi:hypothetical protein